MTGVTRDPHMKSISPISLLLAPPYQKYGPRRFGERYSQRSSRHETQRDQTPGSSEELAPHKREQGGVRAGEGRGAAVAQKVGRSWKHRQHEVNKGGVGTSRTSDAHRV